MSDLATYLRHAFDILERTFAQFDLDGAGSISFDEVLRGLARSGFRDTDDKLRSIFNRVDEEKNGNLHFSEFLVLLYLWAEVGAYNLMIRDQAAAEMIKTAFETMERCYIGYDADRSRKLSHDEFNAFMTHQMPAYVGHADAVIRSVFPPEVPQLAFTKFLFLLYKIVTPTGKYTVQSTVGAPAGVGQSSKLWQKLDRCFTELEVDFRHFDVDGGRCIDLAELTNGVSNQRRSAERLEILTKMEYYFRMVDVDGSESIDFFEFMYLAFLITQNGSYRDLVDSAANAAAVKDCFTRLRAVYKQYDSDGSNRLTFDEVQRLMQAEFGIVPDTAQGIFNRLRSSPDRPHIDFVRFLRLLYEVVMPRGLFIGGAAPVKPAQAPQRLQVAVHQPAAATKYPRFDRVDISKIKKGVVLGQGGQGIAYRAEYEGVPCACKFLLEGATPETCKETKEECELMYRLDHPNIHFLLGFKATMPDICLLTELCDSGSLFDCYMKKRMKFDKPTQWRFARECASGINVLHTMNPPFMHRDLKSLNIFMTKDYICKVADYGMAKNPRDGYPNYQGMGTPQWCAPECLSGTSYDHRIDVYSYGIMLWEITHLKVPYMETNMSQAQISRAVITQNIRPPIAPTLSRGMAALITKCWDRDPARRPTLTQVIQELDAIKGEFCS